MSLIRHDLERPESEHDHWIEIMPMGDKIQVEKNDSKPVFNEDIYNYKVEDGELVFESGEHSTSGAGKSRSTSPSDELDELIRELAEENDLV